MKRALAEDSPTPAAAPAAMPAATPAVTPAAMRATAATATPAAAAISISRLIVRPDRVCCDVRIADHAPRTTSPALMRTVLQRFPTLPLHTCINDAGTTFAACMDETSLPHLMEHLVIDLMATSPAQAGSQHAPGMPAAITFVGTTEWTNEAQGKARIEVSYADDLVALRAFNDAALFLNAAVIP